MRKQKIFILWLSVLLSAASVPSLAISTYQAQVFAGQDLHLVGKRLSSYQLSTGKHSLVFRDSFSMSIGANQFFSDNAVVWLETVTTEFHGRAGTEYKATIYLQDNVSVKKARGAKTTDMSQTLVENGQAMLVRFDVSGEVFVTAEQREISDPHKFELYRTALSWSRTIDTGPKFVIQPEALVPELPEEKKPQQEIWTPKGPVAEKEVVKAKKSGLLEKIFEPEKKPAMPEPKKPRFSYPIVFAPAGAEPLKIDSAPARDGINIATITQRFYVSQKQDEKGRLLELQADNAVVFYSGRKDEKSENEPEDILSSASVTAIYLSGDVVMSEGQRTVRADEIFYDFQRKKAIAVNAVMKNFDVKRGIPVYVRAAKLRQLAENKFAAENITLTTSEFYLPQISVNASSIIITDTTTVDEQIGKVADSSYDAEMRDVRFKAGRHTIFGWPFMRSNLKRPDVPLESLHAGYDNTWGASVETRWYLARLLGLREPEGVESRLLLDYFGKRGLGAGAEIEYVRENYFGRLLGYIIHDTGEDRLGRADSRKDLEPPRELRGRFSWLHRQFLSYNWQLTMGVDYSSDEHFVEQYYRNEFNLDDRETFVHLKRSEDNWALSILGKGRINDFDDELEEMPSVEFHWTGQSLFDDRFTLYSDSQVSRLRQRIGNDHTVAITQQAFTFLSHRTELDMPIWMAPFKIVPYIAGTFGYDDRSGFTRTLVDGTDTGSTGTNQALIGEAGVRAGTQLWKVYPDVKSRLWDLNQLRHVIAPSVTAVFFEENDLAVRQHDVFNIAVSQRLQTKRGPAGNQRTVDWMRLDVDATFVSNPDEVSDMGPGAGRFIWNKPIVPLRVLSAPEIFNGDLTGNLQRFELYGPRRDYFGADYIWRISDTTAVLSDLNYDIQSGVVQQMNVGFSRLCWPNLSYYVGSRYLRRVQVLNEKGSNAFTFAATYILDPRYTVVFAQQFDFDYGANVRSDVTLIRRYHRVCCGFTYSADQSLDSHAIVFSIWPQGVPEAAIGHRRYMGLGGSAGY